jgi:hypothetical protein
MKPTQAHVEWSRQLFDTMRDGGVWGVPRSGLLYVKRGNRLVLTARMPYDPAMPIAEKQFDEQQHADIELIKQHFGAAGIVVETPQ